MALPLESDLQTRPLCPGTHGQFEKDGSEYVIKDPRTPMPWINVIANERYGLVLSQAGGGFSWLDNCQLERLTRWEQDLVQDRQGRFVYVQDVESESAIWSTTYQPTLQEAKTDEIRHGLGYSNFRREINGIETSQTVFVPLTDTCEVWILKVTNMTARSRKLRLATYVDWHLGGVGEFHREFHRLFVETRTVSAVQLAWKHPGLVENKRAQPEAGPTGFHAVNGLDVTAWMSNKAAFLGRPARLDSPASLEKSEFAKGNGRWEDPIASAISDLSLEPGQTVAFTIIVGAADDATEALRLASKYTLETASSELRGVTEYWDSICREASVETDDPALDVMVNYWLRYQTIAGRMVGRCAYYQQGGAFGFRDQLQDSLALLPIVPEKTKKQLIINAEATYEDGGVRHWWHPNTNMFAESRHSDTCLWLPYGTLAYLDETNDLRSMEDQCGFLSRESQTFASSGTWLDHCLRSIDRALSLRSRRGLPLIGAGDWNDGLSHAGLDGKGESVWVGMFLYDILRRWSAILPDLGLSDKAAGFSKAADELKFAVNEYGWDGEWYLEGTRDDGRPLGSKENTSGQIFLNPQTWAVITGIAPEDRIQRAMAAVRGRLLKPYGALLLAPAYSKVDPWVGYITRYAPGSRENGGVYSHASTWAVQALAMMGDSEGALGAYRSMLPSGKSDQEAYAAEPYVMPGNIDGPDSPNEGRAGWTWYTGSSAWMQRIAFDWIFGVRACREGLIVAPLDSGLGAFSLKRKFRGDRFEISVAGSGSNLTVTSDTADIRDGNRIVPSGRNERHQIRIHRS